MCVYVCVSRSCCQWIDRYSVVGVGGAGRTDGEVLCQLLHV